MSSLFARRHYEWLADWAGLEHRTIGMHPEIVRGTTARLARRLREDNPNFNEEKFLKHVEEVASKVRSTRS